MKNTKTHNAASTDAPLSAYEKAAEGGNDPRCVPLTLDGEPPLGDEIVPPTYPESDHDSWRFLFDRQMQTLPGRAADAYLYGVDLLGMERERIPRLRDLSRTLQKSTGWRVARIPGLLHEKDFFRLLSERKFPSTDYIRGKDELDYTPAPDLFHDIFGHMPMLTNPAFADFYQELARASLQATGQDRISLERLHWFTVEFGLIRDKGGIRIFGAGILSSKEEVTHALGDQVKKIPFDPFRIIEQEYDVWHLQPILFVLDSFEQLVEGFRAWARSRGLAAA